MTDDKPTPLSNQTVAEVDLVEHPKSWTGPIQALQEADAKHDARFDAIEERERLRDERDKARDARAERLEQKTDAQTLILTRLDKVTADPRVRALVSVLLMLFFAWLAKHGIEIKVPQ